MTRLAYRRSRLDVVSTFGGSPGLKVAARVFGCPASSIWFLTLPAPTPFSDIDPSCASVPWNTPEGP